MNILTEDTYWARIYLSGPLEAIEQACRSHCLTEGLCVTVAPTRFIYTGGEETGAVVGLINYPRFPSSPEEIALKAKDLAEVLLSATCHHSALIMTPERTEWITLREI